MRRVAIFLWLVLISLSSSAWAAEDPAHAQFRTLRDTVLQAIKDGKLDKALPYLDENIVFTSMNGEICRGPKQVQAYFDKMMVGPNRIVSAVEFNVHPDDLTTIYNGDTGVSYGSSDDVYTLTDGTHFPIQTRWSATMVKKGDQWLLASFQMGTNPFDNPILNKTKDTMEKVAGGVGVAGLILGLVIGRLLGRRTA